MKNKHKKDIARFLRKISRDNNPTLNTRSKTWDSSLTPKQERQKIRRELNKEI